MRASWVILIAACGRPPHGGPDHDAEGRRLVDEANRELADVWFAQARADFANATDASDVHGAAAARAGERAGAAVGRLVERARTMGAVHDPTVARQLRLLSFVVDPSPADPQAAIELAAIRADMQTTWFKGVCTDRCRSASEWLDVMHATEDPAQLRDAWLAWHDGVGRAERPLFERFVPLANAGARTAGFTDVGAMWRSAYDMPPDQLAAETERLWQQVAPLYRALHCYVRRKLHDKYGDLVPERGLIPTHLTRDLYSLNWNQLWPDVEPYPGVAPVDVSAALVAQHYDPVRMVRTGEAFFASLGMESLPATFWERSVLSRPEGKLMACPGQRIWQVDGPDDLRMTMCVQPTHEHLWIIHHELGHAHYHWAMRRLPLILQQAANPGFDEASGDVLQLSMTPAYLHAIGLLDTAATSDQATTNALMHLALDKIAFLPYGYLVDKWRWEAFSGAIEPADYNTRWWQLKAQYQGVGPAVPRTPRDFDPGVQGHLALNFPYMSYFVAGIAQFQLHRALCKKAGFKGPLYECSIYGSHAAGAAYEQFFARGASVPWQDTLEQLSGERQLDATALVEYFAPLQTWLQEQNRGQACGW